MEIEPCHYGVMHAGVCTFDDKYIYKFGGFDQEGHMIDKIERYNIEKDYWVSIDLKTSISDLHLCPKNCPI